MTRRSPKSKKVRQRKRTISPPIIFLLVFGAFFLVGAGYLLIQRDDIDSSYVPEVTGGPSLKADKEQIEFGDVRFNEFVTASFKLTNVGDEIEIHTESGTSTGSNAGGITISKNTTNVYVHQCNFFKE